MLPHKNIPQNLAKLHHRHFRQTRIVGPTTGTGNEKRRTLRKYLTRSSARKKQKRISRLGCKYGNQFKATRFCKKPIKSLAPFFICSCYSMAKANPMTFCRTTILVLFMLFVISLEAAAIYDKNVSCGNKKQGNDSKGIATNKLIVFQSLPRFRAARFHRKQ